MHEPAGGEASWERGRPARPGGEPLLLGASDVERALTLDPGSADAKRLLDTLNAK